jgi:hypothetical protein
MPYLTQTRFWVYGLRLKLKMRKCEEALIPSDWFDP